MWSLKKSTHTHTHSHTHTHTDIHTHYPPNNVKLQQQKSSLPQTSLISPAVAQCCWRWDPHTGQWPWHTAVGWWHSLCVTTAVNHGSDLESTNHCDKKSKLAQPSKAILMVSALSLFIIIVMGKTVICSYKVWTWTCYRNLWAKHTIYFHISSAAK